MQVLQNPAKCFAVFSKPYVLSARWCSQFFPNVPEQYWRRPPPPGEPAKEYPLEAAPEEHKRVGHYRLDRWTDWKMKKDYLRRQMVVRLGRQRMMMDTIYLNDILPVELRDVALQEVHEKYPRDSHWMRTIRRCALTSRHRACVEPWRVSRIMFRHFADYNKLAGVQRGIW